MSSQSRRFRAPQGNGHSHGDSDDNAHQRYRPASTDHGRAGSVGLPMAYEDDVDDDLMNPRASLLKDDASPPLHWGEMKLQHHAATDQEGLSSSRFGIDDIAGGAFAVPASHVERPPSILNISSTTTLEPLLSSGLSFSKPSSSRATPSTSSSSPLPTTVDVATTSHTNSNTTVVSKRRKWQSPTKAQTPAVATSIASTLFSTSLLDDQVAHEGQKQRPPATGEGDAPTPPASSAAGTKQEGVSAGKAGSSGTPSPQETSSSPDHSYTPSSSQSGFSFDVLSKSRKGFVSGLTSLKNSIMIPPAHISDTTSPSPSPSPSQTATRSHRSTPGTPLHYENEKEGDKGNGFRPAQVHSQSLFDNVVIPANDTYAEVLFDAQYYRHHPGHHHHHRRHHAGDRSSNSGSMLLRTMDVDLQAGLTKKNGGGSGGRWGDTSILTQWSSAAGVGSLRSGSGSNHQSRTHSPWTSPSSSTVFLPSSKSGSGGGGPRRHHRTGTFSALQAASQDLAALEADFQRLIQHQSQLLTRKAELAKELISLYSRRNQCERKQVQAAADEQFEEAESLKTRARTISERIAKVELALAETERLLWELGTKKQVELGKSVAQSQLQLIQEMRSLMEQREAKKKAIQEQFQQRQQDGMHKILAEREKLDKERGDIAMSVDFLGKNEQELEDRVEEETKAEQEQLHEVLEARNRIKDEIQELQQRLSQLRAKDAQLDKDEHHLRQNIHEMTAQFDERAKEMRQERAHLDDRISDMNQKAQQLDHAEAEIQAWRESSQRVQDDIDEEIQSLREQQARLTSVHAHFEHEMESIKALYAEEETFRELKARWAIRASNLLEDLTQHDRSCQELATVLLDEQNQLQELEKAIERLEEQIPKLESNKNLAVQQRDFKQAAFYVSEINAAKEALQSKNKELEEWRKTKDDKEQCSKLTQLNKEYERLKSFIQEEEAKLAIEIEVETRRFSNQLAAKEERLTMSATENDEKNGDRGSAHDEKADDKVANSDVKAEVSTAAMKTRTTSTASSDHPQLLLFKTLFKDKLSELEIMRELAKVRFGREEPTLHPTGSVAMELDEMLRERVPSSTVEDSKGNDSGPRDLGSSKQKEKEQIERDIQAAIAEEDYEHAAELQTQLNGLGGAV